MTTKESVLQTIRKLPDDASLEEILDAVLLRLKVERGKRQIQQGQGVAHDEVRERLARWLARHSDIRLTEEVYTDFSLLSDAEREAAEMLVPERRRQRFVPQVNGGQALRPGGEFSSTAGSS